MSVLETKIRESARQYAELTFLLALVVLFAILAIRGVHVPVIRNIASLKHIGDRYVVIKQSRMDPLIVTYIRRDVNIKARWFSVESASRKTGFIISTENGRYFPDGLTEGDKIVCAEGNLKSSMDVGRTLTPVLIPAFIRGNAEDIPKAVRLKLKNRRGEQCNNAPGPIDNVGCSTEAMLVNVKGISSGYCRDTLGEWFYLDDGSHVPNKDGCTGIQVYRAFDCADPKVCFPVKNGTMVEVAGLCTSKVADGVGRVRSLRIRYDGSGAISDKVRFLKK